MREKRKKHVTKIRILGANVKIVSKSKSLTEKATSFPVCGEVISTEIFGTTGDSEGRTVFSISIVP